MHLLMDIWQQIDPLIMGPYGTAILGIVGTIVASVGVLVAILVGRRQIDYARKQLLIQQGAEHQLAEKFPFDCLTADDLLKPEVLGKLRITNSDIDYMPRLPVDQQKQMIDEWRKALNHPEQPRLLLKGVTGLGKTREVIEFLKTIDRELPQGHRLTILMPHSNVDVPQGGLPENLPRENLVLLLNDLHLRYDGVESEPFHSRLQRVIACFEDNTKGYGPFRIIATARSEPELWERIYPDSPLWNAFTVVELGYPSKAGQPVVDRVL